MKIEPESSSSRKEVGIIRRSARFPAVKSWTKREDNFELFTFLGRFFADVAELWVVKSLNRRFCPQIGHTFRFAQGLK